MNKNNCFVKYLYLTFLLVFSLSLQAQEMLVGTYNIRYKAWHDSVNGEYWPKRCQVICDQINFMAPDIFGTQEVLYEQLIDMSKALKDYDYIGVGRDDGDHGGEHEAIFYNKYKLKLLDHGDFWLSETPDKPSLGWDAACIRICTWGKFEVKTNETHDKASRKSKRKKESPLVFYFFNLHMDHVGVVARREAAKLVMERIRAMRENGYYEPVILTGDFNVDQDNEIYKIFTNKHLLLDSYEHADTRFAENGTFNSFDTDLYSKSRIDHVFVSSNIGVRAYGVLTDSYWTQNEQSDEQKAFDAPQEISFKSYTRHNPSDHYPVFVRICFRCILRDFDDVEIGGLRDVQQNNY